MRREPSSAAIESARDSSTRALERTRPGERPPARGTARTIPRFSSMTPPSMHSSLLRILCICGTGCTSECQKDRLQHARRTTHTGTGGSPAAAFTWTRCVVRRDESRACTTPVEPRLPVLLNRNQRCACLQERPSSDAKEEKRSKSARFKKSSEEIGAKGLRKVLNTADTDTQEILPHRASVPRTSGPPEHDVDEI